MTSSVPISRKEAKQRIKKLLDTPSSVDLFRHAPDGTYQEPLFATPAEILGHRSAGQELLERPSVESSEGSGIAGHLAAKYVNSSVQFRDSLATQGMQAPVGLGYRAEHVEKYPGALSDYALDYDALKPTGKVGPIEIRDGHHRLAVSAVERPDDFIPVTFNHSMATDLAAEQSGYPLSK